MSFAVHLRHIARGCSALTLEIRQFRITWPCPMDFEIGHAPFVLREVDFPILAKHDVFTRKGAHPADTPCVFNHVADGAQLAHGVEFVSGSGSPWSERHFLKECPLAVG